MAVDKDTVARIARLARIRISDEQRDSLTAELNDILKWIEQLDEVDTEGVEPMTAVVAIDVPMRDDAVTDGGRAETVVGNAPDPAGAFFSVPKVVE